MRHTEIHLLSKEDKPALMAFISKGQRMARETNRTHLLLALDKKVPVSTVMQVLSVSYTIIYSTRSACVVLEWKHTKARQNRMMQGKRVYERH